MSDYGIRPPNYRLPEKSRPGRVVLQVSDLERSLAYYETVLGLRRLETSASRIVLGAHGSDVPIVELRERKGARPIPRRGLLGLYHFAVLLPDRPSLGRFLRHITEHGVRAGMSDHLVSEAIYLQDPDNLGIEVYADRPRSTWKQSGGELAMATNPLDTDDLLAAAGDAAWTGAPPGTSIGHIHLHVGDIDQAEEFYHKALGFDKMVWSYPGALFMSAGGYHHHLGTNTWARGSPSATDEDARLVEWHLVLPAQEDVEQTAASVSSAGYSIAKEGDDYAATDLWGTRLRLGTRG